MNDVIDFFHQDCEGLIIGLLYSCKEDGPRYYGRLPFSILYPVLTLYRVLTSTVNAFRS